MSGIFQGDLILKAMLDLGIEEVRKNPWILEHMMSNIKNIPYISDKYGQNQIDAMREWFLNNKINIYMRPRNDKDEFPCVTIFPGQSIEKDDMKSLDDASSERILFSPSEINKPIPYIVKPFVPEGYDPEIGAVYIDQTLKGLNSVAPGMILVDPATGSGYVIEDILPNGVMIQADLNITASQFGIVPKYQKYEALIKHSFYRETYQVGCYAHGDPQTLLWLHTIVLYTILRYRQTLLEGNGFAESNVSSGEMGEDPNYEGPGGEQAFVRIITITGQVENKWIDAPKRFIESIALQNDSDPANPTAGIEILSNLDTPGIIDESEQLWVTEQDSESDTE